jgi:serine/threonine protein kinase
VIHRDFKITNLLVDGDTLIVADLGAALTLKQNEKSTEFVGTPSYLAPELVELYGCKDGSAQGYDSKVDIWAIGVAYYKLLFGRFPFKKCGTDMKLTRQVISENSGPNLLIPREINEITVESEDLLRRILTENPEDRITWTEFFDHPVFKLTSFEYCPQAQYIDSPKYFFH